MAFQIGYKNLYTTTGATVTATSEAVGFEKENAYDGVGYDWWKTTNFGNSVFQVDFVEAKTADYFAIYGHDLSDTASAVFLQYWSGSSWSNAISGFVKLTSNNTYYNPFTSASATKWRLIFSTKQNLLLWSEDFDNAVWSKTGTGTSTAASAYAPDGEATAFLLDDTDTDVSEYNLAQSVTIADDTVERMFSVYLKEGTAAQTDIAIYNTGGTTVSSTSRVTWSTHTVSAGTIEDVGDGWYRVFIPVTNNGTGNTSCSCIIHPATEAISTTGTVYAWGAQLEKGSDTTSGGYVKTESVINSALPSIAGIMLGDRLEMPHGAEVGFAVPTIAPKVELKTARSESGAFIGGSQLSQGVEGSFSFTNIDPAWVRTYWEPFLVHAQTPETFVISWDTVTYTTEIMHAWVDGQIPAPNYSSPLYMNFSLNFKGNK